MNGTGEWLFSLNLISILIIIVLLGSVVQGAIRGASGSVRRLFLMILQGIITIISLLVTWQLAQYASPHLQSWLQNKNITIPSGDLNYFKQLYYTVVTGIRDFTLFRIGLLFLLIYLIIKPLLSWILSPFMGRWLSGHYRGEMDGTHSLVSAVVGGAIGVIMGAARSLIIIMILFIYASVYPQSPMTSYIQASPIYQKGAQEIIAPFTGDFITSQIPVFTRAVEQEFNQILQRKYEVVDANVPDDIVAAAKKVTAGAKTDEEKARRLYKWVGSRVKYDWNKVKMYEEQRVWKEQTPQDTFTSREGVCIDYSRLYAVMARAVGLDVKVVTGLGYDGKGGYGPHAWNEVYLAEKDKWVPLDSTWYSSGGNWFNPPNFDQTHIREA
ncbi:transglutaminase domain-containing protein [Paenibacillus larvae]|uniref:Transglutaminase domain protein n=2 Tax=Paenibacillus larvae subsp. larvae TaxID=147375 RepID=V9WCF3_9BACL|nr:transglutaminase domain-containing protein [Paenibacillus larvae]AHD06782.1 transglutaminase domain protein [Paenibacillus larvae subsp. larvae DSM 25430]AVG13343.1 transglutaminase domain protein [Paenibacillus larvae subsp. larvae DSM 25430]MDR5568671.1 transglutaminase domain-containing protein [Paenibacillus larvae]MDR5597056.1 transglutaminase domain-containing protein [Paenibacillus larvae]QHZ53104.1 transglutaminase domain protein [Paenibacillus larvae subsp. larvae]